MHSRIGAVIAGLVGAAVLVGQMRAAAPSRPMASDPGAPAATGLSGLCSGPPPAAAGQDLVACIIGDDDGTDFKEYPSFAGLSAYAFGTTACNNGDMLINWINFGENAHLHPVIAQNLYRLRDGRFEQIGMSWLKHGFCAGDAAGCGACSPNLECATLAIGCSDTYTAQTNGDVPSLLGPRAEVNPVTADYVLPHSTPTGANAGRLQVHIDDLDPALNAGATYYGEAQYVTPDDAGGPNSYNNVTWRKAIVGELVFTTYDLSFTGAVNQQEPAIQAWAHSDPGVVLEAVDVPGDGRFILGSRATNNGDGTWHYEYALYNMTSHRSARELVVPVGSVAITNVGFHDVDYHSGDGIDGTDWPATIQSGGISWATQTEAQDPNANALRWGTLYNFRFDAAAPPIIVTASIGLFRAGTPAQVTVAASGPDPCPWDLDGDDEVGVTDLLALLAAWGTDPDGSPDFDGDGDVGVVDLLTLLGRWGLC